MKLSGCRSGCFLPALSCPGCAAPPLSSFITRPEAHSPLLYMHFPRLGSKAQQVIFITTHHAAAPSSHFCRLRATTRSCRPEEEEEEVTRLIEISRCSLEAYEMFGFESAAAHFCAEKYYPANERTASAIAAMMSFCFCLLCLLSENMMPLNRPEDESAMMTKLLFYYLVVKCIIMHCRQKPIKASSAI